MIERGNSKLQPRCLRKCRSAQHRYLPEFGAVFTTGVIPCSVWEMMKEVDMAVALSKAMLGQCPHLTRLVPVGRLLKILQLGATKLQVIVVQAGMHGQEGLGGASLSHIFFSRKKGRRTGFGWVPSSATNVFKVIIKVIIKVMVCIANRHSSRYVCMHSVPTITFKPLSPESIGPSPGAWRNTMSPWDKCRQMKWIPTTNVAIPSTWHPIGHHMARLVLDWNVGITEHLGTHGCSKLLWFPTVSMLRLPLLQGRLSAPVATSVRLQPPPPQHPTHVPGSARATTQTPSWQSHLSHQVHKQRLNGFVSK